MRFFLKQVISDLIVFFSSSLGPLRQGGAVRGVPDELGREGGGGEGDGGEDGGGGGRS